MKVALIGDVHGNLPALETVLADAQRQRVQAIWNVGDFVGYGPYPNEVIQRLRARQAVSIAGNYDLKVVEWPEKKDKEWKKKYPEKWLAAEWASEQLTAENREYLRTLPNELRLEVEGQRVLLCHGSPAAIDEHVTPDTPIKRLQELAKLAHADVVILGHTHMPFDRTIDEVRFINTGSVGRPDDADPRACYAVATFTAGNPVVVRHYRLEYPVERAVAALKQHGLPEMFVQVVQQGLEVENIEKLQNQAIGLPGLNTEDSRVQAVIGFAEACHYEAKHTIQVTRLALKLFDELRPALELSLEQRLWLQVAALLHDIGWIEGRQGHHKTAQRMIAENAQLPFSERERLIIACIARYHRRALPKPSHTLYGSLAKTDRRTVDLLSGILRVADGLDRTHQDLVQDLSCELKRSRLIIHCACRGDAEAEREMALAKGELLEKVLERKLEIECQPK